LARNLRKFVNPQFLRSVDPALIARLLDRHRHALFWSRHRRPARMHRRRPETRSRRSSPARKKATPRAWWPISTASPSSAMPRGCGSSWPRLRGLQHTRAKNVWFVGILDERLDDFNRKVFQPQIDGSKTGLELPGIVDQVITMAELPDAPARAGSGLRLPDAEPLGLPRPRTAPAGSTSSRSPISAG
jgi:hypothetical protein